MKELVAVLFVGLLFSSCNTTTDVTSKAPLPIRGTWRLLNGTTIEKNDTIRTDYTRDQSFIKIINDSHFAFFKHDLTKGKGKLATYSSGGGTYTLIGVQYTEHLEYCDARDWENNDFKFTISLKNDTLIQTGIERIDSIGVNRVNTEVYIRLNN